ncbi:MAG TPA: type IV toxin-antitoxin system AbiEi family antitoxin domain-containing protein, partial [Acidimicrobiales bacterium]|nr:type IV toxin-antitoxin system AbiEi family antitoxin domain-containing protein [Acidimicrobiales bacterium]
MKQTTRVRAVLARQYGVITTPQALACGLIRGDVRGLVESGTWRRLGRGLFVLSGSPPSFEQKVLGCCLAGGPNAVASHWTAARLLAVGGPVSLTRPVEITVGPTSSIAGARQLGAKVHRSNDLDKHDRVKVARIPVTHPARLLLDLGGQLSRRALEGLVDDVLHRYPAISPHAVLDRVGKRPGGPALRNALQPWLTGPRPDSPPEM